MRILGFLIVIIFITSCDKFSFSKTDNKQALDTIVDFSSVDTFPSFAGCNSIIDKSKKETCFRTTIHQQIGEELKEHTFIIKDSINEIVYVDLIINSKGKFQFVAIDSSEKIKNNLPKLDSLLKASIKKLPEIYPAIKRGIPVTTKYRLPIRIKI